MHGEVQRLGQLHRWESMKLRFVVSEALCVGTAAQFQAQAAHPGWWLRKCAWGWLKAIAQAEAGKPVSHQRWYALDLNQQGCSMAPVLWDVCLNWNNTEKISMAPAHWWHHKTMFFDFSALGSSPGRRSLQHIAPLRNPATLLVWARKNLVVRPLLQVFMHFYFCSPCTRCCT